MNWILSCIFAGGHDHCCSGCTVCKICLPGRPVLVVGGTDGSAPGRQQGLPRAPRRASFPARPLEERTTPASMACGTQEDLSHLPDHSAELATLADLRVRHGGEVLPLHSHLLAVHSRVLRSAFANTGARGRVGGPPTLRRGQFESGVGSAGGTRVKKTTALSPQTSTPAPWRWKTC